MAEKRKRYSYKWRFSIALLLLGLLFLNFSNNAVMGAIESGSSGERWLNIALAIFFAALSASFILAMRVRMHLFDRSHVRPRPRAEADVGDDQS